jgi:ABC-type transport system involved in multi-copper enzyme maturation permease subunit
MTAATISAPIRSSALRAFGSSVTTVMIKELRSRFRGRRAFIIITIYLGVLALLAYGVYAVVAPQARIDAGFGPRTDGFGITIANASATIGQAIFALLSTFELILVAFMAPAFTTGAISLEREKQTLDLLISTPLRPGGIVVGKLLSALAFLILLILAAVPLSALVLMYGGATLDDIVRQQAVLLMTAIGLGSVGLFWSALAKRTQAATVLTYLTVLFLTLGTPMIYAFWSATNTQSSDNPFGAPRPAPEQLLWANPAVAMIDVVAYTEPGSGWFTLILSGLTGSNVVCDGDVCWQTTTQTDEVPGIKLGGAGGAGVQAPAAGDDIGVAGDAPLVGPGACAANARCAGPGLAISPIVGTLAGHFWPRYGLTMAALSVLLTVAAMRLVVPNGMRFAFRRPRPGAAAVPIEPAQPEPPAGAEQ